MRTNATHSHARRLALALFGGLLMTSLSILAGTIVLSLAGDAEAATITIINLDDPGEGFNDPTPVAPVGGNPGTTLGAQRLYVFQFAANIWGGILESAVPIFVEANFDPQTCDASSGVLGSAGANSYHADFPNAPMSGYVYHQALANRLAGVDLSPTADIGITFNSAIGGANCLPQGWYLGVDGQEGTKIELLPVVLHELGHGLGFSTTTLAGVQLEGLPHIYDHFLLDLTQGMHWDEMTESQRAASSMNCSNLVWDGPAVDAAHGARLGAKPLLRVSSPPTTAGDYDVGLPQFGPGFESSPVTGQLVQALDGMGVVTNGCEPLVNAAEVAGKIAFVDRGGCTFVTKVKNAQNAGAIAVVVADSMAGCPPLAMGGADPTITIPSVRITHDDGLVLKSGIALGENVSLMYDATQRAGTAGGHVRVYSPTPFALGSSVSHWDISAEPSLLMEPAITNGLSSDVDLTVEQYRDIGWFLPTVSAPVGRAPLAMQPAFPNPTAGAATVEWTQQRAERADLGVYDVAGRLVRRLISEALPAGPHRVTWDGNDAFGNKVRSGVYQLRLRTPSVNETGPVVVVR